MTAKSNFRGSEMMKEGVGLPGQMCSEDEAVCLFPEKLVIDGVPLNAQTGPSTHLSPNHVLFTSRLTTYSSLRAS